MVSWNRCGGRVSATSCAPIACDAVSGSPTWRHRAGVSPQYLSELERGKKDPSSEIMSAVAGALDLTVAELTLSTGRRLAATQAATNRTSGPVCLAA